MYNEHCQFSLWSPVDAKNQFVEDMAFSCFAQATEGDFTVGRDKLNTFCENLATLYNTGQIDEEELNNPNIHRQLAKALGFNWDNLLDEEVDYCIALLEGKVVHF